MLGLDLRVPEHQIEDKEQEIVITIVAPLSKPNEAALVLEKNLFTFDSPPYWMRFKLPHPVCDRLSHEAYDSISGTYTVTLKKTFVNNESTDEEEEEDDITNFLHESLADGSCDSSNEIKQREKQYYGFANRYCNMFGKLYNEFAELINLPEPDATDVKDRSRLRQQEENEKWNEDHYLADTMEVDHLSFIFIYIPPWIASPVTGDLNKDEKEMLLEISRSVKHEELSEESRRLVEFQLIDILFAFVYNKRTTEGDNTVESGWTINKLSSSLSWFEVFEDLKSVLVACYKRCLVYPLYRNWKVCELIHKDVIHILEAGANQVTRCLLEVREIFNDSDNRYILNTLYINDLCHYASSVNNERLLELAGDLKQTTVQKPEINKDLLLLEVAAYMTAKEDGDREGSQNLISEPESNVREILEKIEKLKIHRESDSSSDDSSSSESDSDESTQSSDDEK